MKTDIFLYATVLWFVISCANSKTRKKTEFTVREIVEAYAHDLCQYLMMMALIGLTVLTYTYVPVYAWLAFPAALTIVAIAAVAVLAGKKKPASPAIGQEETEALDKKLEERAEIVFYGKGDGGTFKLFLTDRVTGKCAMCGSPTHPPEQVAERFSNGFTEICRNCYDKATE